MIDSNRMTEKIRVQNDMMKIIIRIDMRTAGEKVYTIDGASLFTSVGSMSRSLSSWFSFSIYNPTFNTLFRT